MEPEPAHSIIRKLEQVLGQREQWEKEKQQHIQERLGKTDLTSEPVSLAELHVLALIGHDPRLNVINIAKQMQMTRGAISKICARLERKGLVNRVQLPSNQKEVYFKLTPGGTRLWELHEEEHRKVIGKYQTMLDAYSRDEQRVIERFLNDLMQRRFE
ncbi:hypothetical protein AWM70_16035 [Paenibacillus yonginensis]|uniref:HTH marR-type domain-containing protein n=1 Tax=Paenibacillus yonginensis TaxID=1462996 RepID=A0A1B1N3A1_9BACL|nr:MarR family transcriptional regulator [Paenibacillus yonginensis]ANS75908.1 hypothetical protein AWM70_16035 [Paenibacillus yonginensis]